MKNISVVLATYNGEKYLQEQVESIIQQTLKVQEIVIVDDCSSDKTAELAAALGKRYSAIKFYQNDRNLGYRENFMKACRLASGDFIFFCDQDDVWSTEKVERVIEGFADPQTLLVYHNAIVTDEVLNPIGRLDRHSLGKEVARFSDFRSVWFSSLGFTQAIRRDLMRYDPLWSQSLDHNKHNQLLAHDQWFFFLAGLLGNVRYLDSPLARYRQHGANVDGWGGRRSLLERVRPKSQTAVENFARASENRIATIGLLEEIEGRNPQSVLASERFQRVAKLYQRRSNIYRRVGLFARIYWFLRCIQAGYFGSLGRDEGGKSLLQDVFYGLYRRSLG